MSFIFGGVRGREDPELAAGNRRTRLHFARDVNDERALADDRPPAQRNRGWAWLAVATVVLAVLALVGTRGAGDVPLAADCDTPAIAVASSVVAPGAVLRYRLTGADGVDYVATLDGAPVQGDAGSTVSYIPTAAGPALQLRQCLSPTLAIAAPAGDGPHELAMLRVAADGSTEQVAAVIVTVDGVR
ncbi:hypothetical protein [Modestobacter roseus]|uniref:Uncharacterized protein n=1 Tax=Modestobacter roseus TaxID=1181884 RepID=A0A562IUT6_9ACTN|nr:hypothetical protein [Modestobacter roseus]MQA32928.1 hypothetical protein [Modestobacter roseus]TWH74620.1 hypothetical protein JD78_03164 [Modestobacter roseus]